MVCIFFHPYHTVSLPRSFSPSCKACIHSIYQGCCIRIQDVVSTPLKCLSYFGFLILSCTAGYIKPALIELNRGQGCPAGSPRSFPYHSPSIYGQSWTTKLHYVRSRSAWRTGWWRGWKTSSLNENRVGERGQTSRARWRCFSKSDSLRLETTREALNYQTPCIALPVSATFFTVSL